jgi:3'-phosphoadenosine 5'-phosphosulfate sulfotransferase (PAPS reductase)/FAD synthetase
MLGFKQNTSNDTFIDVYRNIERHISKQDVDAAIGKGIARIKSTLQNRRFGLAWSGGKDSVVLEFITRQAYKEFPSCIGMTDDLEYPEFLRFVTNNMPSDLTVYNSGQNLKWLSENLSWLFPKDSTQAAKWFKAVQHSAQNKFFKEKDLELLLTGRRKLDKNYVGKDGIYRNKQTGVVRYSPIYDFTHEEVLGILHHYRLPLAPFYSWNNGFVVGTGSWAARQWTGTIERAWEQVYSIDPSVVMKASKYIKSAEEYVWNLGLSSP